LATLGPPREPRDARCSRTLRSTGLRRRPRRRSPNRVAHAYLPLEEAAYEDAASLSWRILRSPFAAWRKRRGGPRAERWKVRTKLERSPKPTSKATSVIERAPSASRDAARRRRERTRYWCGVTPRILAKSRRKWKGLSPAAAAVSSRSIGSWAWASIQSAASTARRRARPRASPPARPRPEPI